jgi:hypothetical protein
MLCKSELYAMGLDGACAMAYCPFFTIEASRKKAYFLPSFAVVSTTPSGQG